MPKKSDTKLLEKTEDVESSSSSENSGNEGGNPVAKKERKPYVMTEARKLAFERARMKREENIKLKKELKEKDGTRAY